ncbi:polysaccharide pyruvyl transferase family protein [Halomonas alimentaria]|uniref:polysaccharide pyruvyl transferase family protein n=1 Tax=Halomonas alimentaria TaxID=147248 RepID=UPI002492A023|nr:polysaccharide pyruvyl transferase family protein [Halomonas alimentaria]
MDNSPAKRVKKIAVFFGHVASNLGDLAINVGELNALKAVFLHAEITFVALHIKEGPKYELAKAETALAGDAQWQIYRTSFRHAIDYMAAPGRFFEDCGVPECDLVVLASGEHLFAYQDNHNLRSLYWRTLPALAARLSGKPCVQFPSTFGPFETEESNKLVESIFSITDAHAARDASSVDYLKDQFGIEVPLLPDPAFFISPKFVRSLDAPVAGILGLAMRAEDWGIRLAKDQRTDVHDPSQRKQAGNDAIAFSCSVIDAYLIKNPSGKVHVFVQTDADESLALKLKEKLSTGGQAQHINILKPGTISEYIECLAQLDGLIASRFHALILGLLVQTPVFGVYFPVHGHKILGLFSWLGAKDHYQSLETSPEEAGRHAVDSLFEKPFDWETVLGNINVGREAFLQWLAHAFYTDLKPKALSAAMLASNGIASRLIHEGFDLQKEKYEKNLYNRIFQQVENEYRKKFGDSEIKLETLYEKLDGLSKANAKLEQDAAHLRGQLNSIRHRTSYQLAAEVARTICSRKKILTLPIRLFATLKASRSSVSHTYSFVPLAEKGQGIDKAIRELTKSCNSTKQAAQILIAESKALSQKGYFEQSLFVAMRAVELYESEGTFRALFWAQQNAGLVEEAYQTLLSLRMFLGDKPTVMQRERLELLYSQPAYQLNLREQLPVQASQPVYQPVKRRLAYVLHNSLPYSSGGYATRAQGLARGLTAKGYEVIAFTRPGYPVDINSQVSPADVPSSQVIDGVTYVRSLEPSRKKLKMKDFLPAATDVMIEHFKHYKPEVVVAASNYICALPALFAARKLGIPFVYEVRGFWEITRLSREPGFINNASYKIQELMEAFVCNQADQVLTLTKAMRAELARRGVDEAKIELVPNACEPERFQPGTRDADLASHLSIPENVPVIGYIGTFVDYEGLEDLARACGLLKEKGQEFRLLLVGNENVSGTGRGPISQAILDAADRYRFRNWLIMPGRVRHEKVAAYYSLIDIAPFPRKPWPVCEMVSPMKPMEAMAMEKMVVVSSVSALAEMVGQGEFGVIFEKGNERALACALSSVISDPELRSRMGRVGREHVLKERTWLRSSERFANAIAPFSS